MKANKYPAKKLLRTTFFYKDGHLYWRSINKAKNNPAGGPNVFGYWRLGLNGKRYLIHRLIWIYHYDSIPDDKEIDHCDTDKGNNKIENLRLVSKSQNRYNIPKTKIKKSSKYKGVVLLKNHPTERKWKAYARLKGKNYNLGHFSDEKQAALAYNEFAEKNIGKYANLNKL